MNFHIYRITKSDIDAVTLSINECPIEGFETEILASFKTAGLRDIAFSAFAAEIRRNQDLYPHHKILGEKK